jgi:hypothetical protein
MPHCRTAPQLKEQIMLIRHACLSAFLLVVALPPAMSTEPTHVSNNERSFVEHGTEYRNVEGKWQRVDTWNRLDTPAPDRRPYRRGDISSDGNYVYVGGDRLWILRSHAYRFENGRLVHADTLRHDTPRPSLQMTEAERRSMQEQNIGGP